MANEEFDAVRRLAHDQLEAFDTEYVVGARWDVVRARIEGAFPEGDFTFLDVGGGNGRFADLILETFPRSSGTVLDNSSLLLGRNRPHPRKQLECDSVETFRLPDGVSYDLVCVHWVLHHLVSGSYRSTRKNQVAALMTLRGFLSDRGRISLYENMCEGWMVGSLPGRLIFQATSSTLLSPLTTRFGANTAGIGVCFLSRQQWDQTLHSAGFTSWEFSEPDDWVWPLRPIWRLALGLKRMSVGHYWLES